MEAGAAPQNSIEVTACEEFVHPEAILLAAEAAVPLVLEEAKYLPEPSDPARSLVNVSSEEVIAKPLVETWSAVTIALTRKPPAAVAIELDTEVAGFAAFALCVVGALAARLLSKV